MKKLIAIVVALVLLGVVGATGIMLVVSSSLPKMITLQDYQPLLVSEVFDRDGNKIGEFFREKRMLIPYDQMPKQLVDAFIAAEDSSFFTHGGLNYLAIVRAFFANIKAGRKVQGGSTITQQVARSLLLSSEKTYVRKIKEAILSQRMEDNLSKQDILYLYLNQIYLGQGAYGVEAASQIYFRKPAKELTVAEAALLAGLPQAPSRYSPISNPSRAKERQRYVLTRMSEEGFITPDEARKALEEPVKVFVWKNYKEIAPFYLETIRQLLVAKLGEETVLDKGIKIHTGLDLKKQTAAQNEVQAGLRDLDKRQGFRGPIKNLDSTEAVAAFLLQTRNELMDEVAPDKVLKPDGHFDEKGPLNLSGKNEAGQPLPNIPAYTSLGQIVKGIVIKIDDEWGLVHVRFAESRGLIDLETMKWARKPDPNVRYDAVPLKKPSDALKVGDVVQIRLTGRTFVSSRISKELSERRKKSKDPKLKLTPPELPDFTQYAAVELEQEPSSEAALVSIDERTGEIISLVGGYDFARSQFNRALQALRQTGSSFKSLVYGAALDKSYTPATPLLDVPLVYEEPDKAAGGEEGQDADALATKKWKPANHSKSFEGDVLFRTALIKSLNVPTVKIIEDIGVDWVATYARRLGIFSPLNMDFTLALGSSGVTVYEMTRAFATIGRMGQKVTPLLIHRVLDKEGQTLLEEVSLDERFATEIAKADEELEKKKALLTPEELEINSAKALPLPDGEEAGREASATPEQKKLASRKVPPIFFNDPNQLIRPQTAYVLTTMLQAVIDEPGGTGGAARALGRPAAGKTGSTSGYYDAWFIGYTPDIATGVWVGYDEEKSLGRGEVGGRAALPIWLEYMKAAHEGLPTRSFTVPEGVVFANIDAETGKLASANSKSVVRQAFIEGSEPQTNAAEVEREESQQFYKEDLSE
ncbi:MAG: penicillin-binding protein 1A [Bdellovibrionales bacterium]